MKQSINSSEKYRKNRTMGIGKKYPKFEEISKNNLVKKLTRLFK